MFAASNGGVLHALDPSTGKDRWTFDGKGSYGVDLSTSAAFLADGTVLWPGPNNAVYALDGRTGALRWKTTVAGEPHTPAVSGAHIYVQDSSGTLSSLAPDGKPEWKLALAQGSYASPALGRDGTVYSAAADSVFAVRDGKIAWRVRTHGQIEVSPAVAPDGTVTVGSNDRHQYGVSPSGRVRWRYDIGDLTYSSAAVTPDNLVYLGDHRGLVSALDARTGELRYRVLGKGRSASENNVGVWTRPAVDGEHDVYFGTHLGHVHGFDARGRRLLDVDLGGVVDSYPVITRGGLLVVGSESGTLTALG